MVPVPIHPKKHKERGFNQAEILAKELAKLKGIDLEKKALVKVKNTLPQTTLTSEERAANVKGVFQLKDKERIKGKIILLIDDVYTTGSTLRECSLTLLEGGAREVRAVTVAQA